MAIDIEQGFRRLTRIVAIVSGVFISGGLIVAIFTEQESGFSINRPLGIIVGVLLGIAAYFAVWGIFYLLRWIIQGFVRKKN